MRSSGSPRHSERDRTIQGNLNAMEPRGFRRMLPHDLSGILPSFAHVTHYGRAKPRGTAPFTRATPPRGCFGSAFRTSGARRSPKRAALTLEFPVLSYFSGKLISLRGYDASERRGKRRNCAVHLVEFASPKTGNRFRQIREESHHVQAFGRTSQRTAGNRHHGVVAARTWVSASSNRLCISSRARARSRSA